MTENLVLEDESATTEANLYWYEEGFSDGGVIRDHTDGQRGSGKSVSALQDC